jgi:hypothetical protein
MTTRLEKLTERAKKCGGECNVKDALDDLFVWPYLSKQILDDLEQAIEAREQEIWDGEEEDK